MKGGRQKITNKEIEFSIAKIYQEIAHVAGVVDSLGTMMIDYIDYKKDKKGFIKHCEDKKPKEKDERGK